MPPANNQRRKPLVIKDLHQRRGRLRRKSLIIKGLDILIISLKYPGFLLLFDYLLFDIHYLLV